MKRFFFSALIPLLCAGTSAFAGGAGTTGMNFLKLEAGAKAAGSGGAFSAVADDGSAFYWNPAGLAAQRYQQLSVMHLSWLEGINYQYASFVRPVPRFGTLAAALCYLSVNDIPSYDASGARRDGDLSASDLAFILSYARRVGALEWGVSAKYLREQLADESAATYAFDAGALYRLKTGTSYNDWLGPECRLALVVQNVGPAVKFISDASPLPLAYRLGIAQDFFSGQLTFSCDAVVPNDAAAFTTAGLDYRIADWVSLRAGYRFSPQTSSYDIQPGPVGGIGFGNDYVSVDYAFVPFSSFGATHRIGINYRFGRARDRDVLETKELQHLSAARRFLRSRDLVNAYREFSNVLLLDPVNSEAKESLAALQKNIDGVKADKYLAEARRLLVQDRLLEARELLETVRQVFPDNPSARNSLAVVDAALETQKEQREDSVFSQGLDFFNQKRYPDAISLWEKVLLVNPGHLQAKEYIVRAKEEMARIDEKNRQDDQALRRKKSEVAAAQGMKAYQAGRWEDAKTSFEEARKIFPQPKEIEDLLNEANGHLADDRYRKGLKRYSEKKLPEAIRLWEEAASLDPRNPETAARLNAARAELKEANAARAEEYSRQGLKEYGLGNLAEAVALWEKAVALDPDNGKIRNSLSRAREELRRDR